MFTVRVFCTFGPLCRSGRPTGGGTTQDSLALNDTRDILTPRPPKNQAPCTILDQTLAIELVMGHLLPKCSPVTTMCTCERLPVPQVAFCFFHQSHFVSIIRQRSPWWAEMLIDEERASLIHPSQASCWEALFVITGSTFMSAKRSESGHRDTTTTMKR